MIVFYAHTGTLLLNMLNLKMNQFQNRVADIYIFNSERMPKHLITLTKQSKTFRNVIVVEPCKKYFSTKISMSNNLGNILSSALTLLFQDKYYSKIISSNNINVDEYTSIITHGLWLDSIYFVKYFYKLNKDITIQIMDEGIGTNTNSLQTLANPKRDDLFPNKVQKLIYDIIWFINTGHCCNHDIVNLQKQITDYYLYCPQESRLYQETSLTPHKLLPLDSNNKLTPLLDKMLDKIDFVEYINRKVWILSDYDILESHPSHSIFMRILETVLNPFSQKDIILKAHPGISSLNKQYYSTLWPELYLDDRKYQLEILYSKVDLNSKILITRLSSSVFYSKYMFGAEPYIIFTYKLSPKDVNVKYMDEMVSSLKELYKNKGRIFVPSSLNELEVVVSHTLSEGKNGW